MFAAPTEFAPSARADWDELAEQMALVRKNQALSEKVWGRRESTLLLNADRQVIFANQAFQDQLSIEDPATLYGCRPGEILGCRHAGEGEGGCGTSKHCRCCPAVHAILSSLRDSPDIQRCSIQIKDRSEPLAFLILTAPVTIHRFSCILVELAEPELEASQDFGRQILRLQRVVAEIEGA
jgi:hypothetical protein